MIQKSYLDSMEYKRNIAKQIYSEFKFNEYIIEKNILTDIVKVICELNDKYKIKEETSLQFFNELHNGKLGMLRKPASDIVSKYWNYIDNKRLKLS